MTKKTAQARTGYHHGNLVEALVAAAIAIIEEKGVDNLSVREVAKRAGVSVGAPFRHFESKTALLTAVAEQAIERLTLAVTAELSNTDDSDPVQALHAIGRAYLSWVLENPTHFQVVSSRSLINFSGSPKLVEQNENIRLLMIDLIARGQQDGHLSHKVKPEDLLFCLRAMGYGIARMWADGHFEEWKVDGPPQQAMLSALDVFISSIRS